MSALLRVAALPPVDHNERSKAQPLEATECGMIGVERGCALKDKNRIEGLAEQGERD